MAYDKIKIADLQLAEYNPRSIDETEIEKLEKSIEEFGLVDPLVINLKNNRIIGGHQRYQVLHKQNPKQKLNLIKLGDIGWAFTDTDLNIQSEEHEKALNVALNKIGGEWDNDKLSNMLEELQVDGYDLSTTGFDNLSTDPESTNFGATETISSYSPTGTSGIAIDDTDDGDYEEEEEEISIEEKYNIDYNIIFPDEELQSQWFAIVQKVKAMYEDSDLTITDKICLFLRERL